MAFHAKYSASSLDRLRLCPASARMAEGIENKSSEAAERGTRIHGYAEQYLNGETPTGLQDELDMALEYSDFVESLVGDDELFVEVDVTDGLRHLNPNFGGSSDAVIRRSDELVVIDLKTGNKPVQAEENPQALTYALGALNKLGWDGIRIVTLCIWQPGNISSISYQVKRMHEWERELVAIGNAADNPFEQPKPGAKQCYFCRAKPTCHALHDKAVEVAKSDFAENELEKLLDQVELVSLWVDSVKDMAKEKIAAGADGGKWRLSAGRKTAAWKDKFAVEDHFWGNPQCFEIKTVAQVRKLGMEVPEQFIEEKISAPSLIKSKEAQ